MPGRKDNQVKISGYRIELDEINTVIMSYPNIKKSITIVSEIGNKKRLISYFTASESIEISGIIEYLSSKLAHYMIPFKIIQLEEFPLTSNGKIDKKALPKFTLENKSEYAVPKNNTQEKLLSIWIDLFDTNKISIYDNFFHLGGDSLLCIKLSSRIYEKFNIKVSIDKIFRNPTISDLSELIDHLSIDDEKKSITVQPKSDFYPISYAQKRTYLASKMDSNSTLYNIYGGILLDSMPDITKLQSAINIIVTRHESLRTYFEIENKQVVQKIITDLDIKINIQDVNTNNANELFYIYTSNFDLSKAPLFNITLCKLPNGKALLMLDVHHIIFDGISLNNFIDELSSAYNGKELPKLDMSYKDFAVWENEALENGTFKSSKEFWLEKFKGDLPVLNLPTVYERPKVKSYKGITYKYKLSKEITKKINNFANTYDVTPYMIMLACYYVLLNKYSDNEDIIVGTPSSGRMYKELEPLLGMFVNTIPLRCNISPNMEFEEFLQNIKNTCVDAFTHQEYPFDVLVNDLKIKKYADRSILFDTMFTYQNNGINLPKFGEISTKYIYPMPDTSKFDISLDILPKGEELILSFEYCTKLFDEIFIGNFAKSYENILINILENPKMFIKDISIINNNDKENSVYKFNKIELSNNHSSNLYGEQIKLPDFESENTSNVFSGFTNQSNYDTISDKVYNEDYIAPRNAAEQKIAKVFENLLSTSHIGIDDNFFDLGGDSLAAINLQIELLKLDYKLTYSDIFECPTIRELVKKIDSNKS